MIAYVLFTPAHKIRLLPISARLDIGQYIAQPIETHYRVHLDDFLALFIEKDGYVKASFRSKGNFPANEFSSSHFNGGGHLNAAGGESELNFEKTLLKFTQLLPEYKHQLLETTI